MIILDALKQLRDDIKTWVTNNLNALNAKIDEKTIPIDSELSSTSTNPVQNKAIAKEIDSINDRVGNTSVATQILNAIDKVPTFSGDYNDLANAPNITEDDSGNMIIADESGNIIFKTDADGIHTTAVSINGEAAATEKYVDEAVANIDIPEVDFAGYATETFVNEAIANIDFPEADLTGYATETYVDNKVADLVNSAPEALDTLGELAEALENHEDAYDALLETVGGKATKQELEDMKSELSESIVAEADEWKVVDEAGNIIFIVDDGGAHTTSLTLNGQSVEDMIDDKVDKVSGKGLSTNDFTNEYKNKLDNLDDIVVEESDPTVPAWAKEANKPTYTAAEVGLGNVDNTSDLNKPVSTATQNAINDLKNELSESIVSEATELTIVDEAGNIVTTINELGLETTTVRAQNIVVNGNNIEDLLQNDSDIFIAQYGVTTFTEIFEAVQIEGKAALCHMSDGSTLPLAYAHIDEIKFVGHTFDGKEEVICSMDNVWSSNNIDIMSPQLNVDMTITLTPDKMFYYANPDLQLGIDGTVNAFPNGWTGFLTVYAPTTTGSITTSILETTSENGFTFTDIGNMESYSMAIFKTGASSKLKWYLFKSLPAAEGASF